MKKLFAAGKEYEINTLNIKKISGEIPKGEFNESDFVLMAEDSHGIDR